MDKIVLKNMAFYGYQHYQGIVGLSVTVRKPSVPIAGILDYVEVVTTRGQI